MSNLIYEFDYKPTMKELKTGGRLISKNLYGGPWRVAVAVKSLFLSLSTFIVGLVVAMIAFQTLEVAVSDAPLIYYGTAMCVGLAILVVLAALSSRPARVFFEKLQNSDLKAKISAEGIELSSPDWKYFSSWSKIDGAHEKNGLLVFAFAHLGFILSDRMLASIGAPAEVKVQITDWYDQKARMEAK